MKLLLLIGYIALFAMTVAPLIASNRAKARRIDALACDLFDEYQKVNDLRGKLDRAQAEIRALETLLLEKEQAND